MTNDIPEDTWTEMIDTAYQQLPPNTSAEIKINWYKNGKDIPDRQLEKCIIEAYEWVSQFEDVEEEFQAKVEEYLID